MKKGYYLSTYVHIDPLCCLKNIQMRHDQNMALWYWDNHNLTLIHYWELERETGLKQHSRSFYSNDQFTMFANELLAQYKLTLEDIKTVIGTPGIHTCSPQVYASYQDFPNIEYHAIAHMFSSLLMDTSVFRHDNILSLALDGGPDMVLEVGKKRKIFCGSFSEKGQIKKLVSVSSPAPLWGAASHLFHLREGTLMALATACKSQAYIPETSLFPLDETEQIQSDSSEFRNYLQWLKQLVWSLDIHDSKVMFVPFDNSFTEDENRISIFMKEIIRKSIQIIEKEIDELILCCNIKPENCCLSMSGGFALNCPINSYLMQKYKFKRFIAPPCVSDSGISLGYGLYFFWKHEPAFSFHFQNAYYGDQDDGLDQIVKKPEYALHIHSIQAMDYTQAVDDLLGSPMIWFSGRSEIGPRALGNRSILADPRFAEMKNQLNKIKLRQWWRPVASVVLQDEALNWFEDIDESPYMLRTYYIRQEKEDQIPAIAHLDQSARVQTVSDQDNPELAKLIQAFFSRTGVPMLCNTSLNDRGEPIINCISEALDFALKKRIEIVYINDMRIQLNNFDCYTMPKNNRCFQFLNYLDTVDIPAVLQKLNPHHLNVDALYFYYYSDLRNFLALTDKKHASIIEKISRVRDNNHTEFFNDM